MLLGEYEHTIDAKGRLTIPSKFREELTAGIVVTQGLEKCLFIYPGARWDELAKKIDQVPFTKKDVRTFVRLFFSGAAECQLDPQGRILLPSYLREYASLDSRAVIIGLYSRLEIWNPSDWREVKAQAEKEGGMVAEHLSDFLERTSSVE